MNILMVVLRLLHVFSGIFWVGSVLFLYLFVFPTIQKSGESGQKFLGALMTQSRMSTMLASAGGLTLLAGATLYWIDSDGFTSKWLSSGPGIGFGLGAVCALIGFAFGVIVAVTNKRIASLAPLMQSQPSPEQATMIQVLRRRLATVGPLNMWFLILAAIFMATSRYFTF